MGMAATLVLVSLLSGFVGAAGVQDKADAIRGLVAGSEPLTGAAQELYRSLSDADATASSAFLSGGIEPAGARTQYAADIAKAGSALAMAASSTGGSRLDGSPLVRLTTQLPVYTGLVETARANNRQGFPV